MATRAAILALAAAWTAACCATPAVAATQNASVTANIVKPLVLTSLQSLDLGTITLKPGTWTGATVGISRAGVFNCANTNLICTGATQVATYSVAGTNNQTVRVSAPDVTLKNVADASKTLTLVVDNPGTVALPNSGSKGVNFSLGGSITLSSAAASGTYEGTFAVTVDYQ